MSAPIRLGQNLGQQNWKFEYYHNEEGDIWANNRNGRIDGIYGGRGGGELLMGVNNWETKF